MQKLLFYTTKQSRNTVNTEHKGCSLQSVFTVFSEGWSQRFSGSSQWVLIFELTVNTRARLNKRFSVGAFVLLKKKRKAVNATKSRLQKKKISWQ